MTKQIHSGIAAGQVPEGYKLEHGYVIPKEWKVVHFNECFHRLTQKNTENNQNVLTISAQQGLISQLDYYNTLYASEDKTGYFLLQKGDFAYNKSYSADYAYGAIKQLEKYDKGIVSPLYICFSANEGTNTDFYRQYFEAGMFNREIYKIAQKGARNHGLLNVSTPEFFSAVLVFPPVEEQKKIAEVLSCCNRVIELKQQLIVEMQRLKSGFLQAMFPAKGHSEPDIRFPEFSGDWEQRKLASLCEKFTDGDWIESKDQSDFGVRLVQTGNVGVAEYLDKPNNKKWISEDTFDRLHCEEVLPGDILISRLPEPAGRACIMPLLGTKMITAVDCTIVRTAPDMSNKFLVQYLSSQAYFDDVNICLAGGTRQRISRGNLANFDVPIPVKKSEQDAIGMFFGYLDNLITLHQRELEETKKKKKSLAKLLLTGSVRVPT